MAKIGETDSRWIVARRADGKNVDNWHWNEKDLFPWIKGRFESSLKDIDVAASNSDITKLVVEKTDSIDGTAIICNRKAKTLYVFDITMTLKWSGKIKCEGAEIEGKGIVLIEEISNTEDKWKIIVKMDEETSKNRPLKTELQNSVGNAINKIIDDILEDMKKQYAPTQESVATPAVITPSAPVRVSSHSSSPTTPHTSSSASTPAAAAPASPAPAGSPAPVIAVKTKNMTQKVTFEIVPKVLYETLLDASRMSALSGSPATLETKVNSKFSLFGGTVVGTIVELTPPKKIVQKWRFSSWPENHYSIVTMSFEASGDKTVLSLSQTGIPEVDFERTRSGWESHFWQRIRGLFGWGYSM